MFVFEQADKALGKTEIYALMEKQLGSLVQGEGNIIANAANMCALVYHQLQGLNWCGFYFVHDNYLVLGPFQGKVACTRIAVGQGVCGTAAHTRQTHVVPNVHDFPGHISCDSASQSEIVVPLQKNGSLIGVWDVDSPHLDHFDENDTLGMEMLCDVFLHAVTL